MIASIHQPEHLPWLGYIHKINISDVFIFLDNVQFKKNYFENRNKIYTPQGVRWLTAGVNVKNHTEKQFCEIVLVDNWKKKYLKTLKQNYSKASFFKDVEPVIDFIGSFVGDKLADLNIGIIEVIVSILGIQTNFFRAKDLGVNGKKTELLINILTKINANSYIVGKSGFDYMDLDLFSDNNIDLIPHNFSHPKYIPFNFKDKISDYPSIIDVIANLGLDEVKRIINENNI